MRSITATAVQSSVPFGCKSGRAGGAELASRKTLGIGKRADDSYQYRFLAWK